MASVSISSSPVCSMKLQQQLSSSSLLSSPNTSSSSSTTTLSPTSSSSGNPNSTTPTQYSSHALHSHHQLQLAQIQQHIAQQQQQSHRINNSNNLNNASVGNLTIKKEPGLISPPGISAYVTNNNNSGMKNTMLVNANCNNNSPISNTSTNMNTNACANNNVCSSTTTNAVVSNANSNEIFCSSNNNLISTTTANSKCKRKINFSHLGIPNRGHQPATVARRNARERNRVKQVNNGFSALKQHIPLGHRSKKMSKVETLRCAVDYIKNLKSLLDPNGVFTSEEDSTAFDQLHFDFGMGSGSGGSTQQLSPTSSEDPSSPSYASEGSYVASSSQPANNTSNNNAMYDYENYEPVSPEDEELLDAISWWQQS